MEEQVSIIVTVLAALLTGGFLMIFIESQQVANNMAERFHFIMRPFFHSFTNYARFISSWKSHTNLTHPGKYFRPSKVKIMRPTSPK